MCVLIKMCYLLALFVSSFRQNIYLVSRHNVICPDKMWLSLVIFSEEKLTSERWFLDGVRAHICEYLANGHQNKI